MYREFQNPAETFELEGFDGAKAARDDVQYSFAWNTLPTAVRSHLAAVFSKKATPSPIVKLGVDAMQQRAIIRREIAGWLTAVAAVGMLALLLFATGLLYQSPAFVAAYLIACILLAWRLLRPFAANAVGWEFAGVYLFSTDIVELNLDNLQVFPLALLRASRTVRAEAEWQLHLTFWDGRSKVLFATSETEVKQFFEALDSAHCAVATDGKRKRIFDEPLTDVFCLFRSGVGQPIDIAERDRVTRSLALTSLVAVTFGMLMALVTWHMRNIIADIRYFDTLPSPPVAFMIDQTLLSHSKLQAELANSERALKAEKVLIAYKNYLAHSRMCTRCIEVTVWLSTYEDEINKREDNGRAEIEYAALYRAIRIRTLPLHQLTSEDAAREAELVEESRARHGKILGKGDLATGFFEQQIAKGRKSGEHNLYIFFTAKYPVEAYHSYDFFRYADEKAGVAGFTATSQAVDLEKRWVDVLKHDFAQVYSADVMIPTFTKNPELADIVIKYEIVGQGKAITSTKFMVNFRQSGTNVSVHGVAPSLTVEYLANDHSGEPFGYLMFPAPAYPKSLPWYFPYQYAAFGELYKAVHAYFFSNAPALPP
jgi:hypothetical protein